MKLTSLLLVFLTMLSLVTAFNSCTANQDVQNQSEEITENFENGSKDAVTDKKTKETDDLKLTDEAGVVEFSLLSNGTYAVKKLLDTNATEISIPDKFNEKAVTKILRNAFKGATKLTSVVIPNSINEIVEGAFSGCSALESITVPFVGQSRTKAMPIGHFFGTVSYAGGEKVTQYYDAGEYHSPKTYYIPKGLKKVTVTDDAIKDRAFNSCLMLEEIVIGDGVKEIQPTVFAGCENIKSITIGAGVTKIESECFELLYGLKNIVIGKNVQTIGDHAFYHCKSLESVVIPRSVTTIDKYAFAACTSLKSIVFECKTGWYRDYGPYSDTDMNVDDPAVNAENLSKKYTCDRWKRK